MVDAAMGMRRSRWRVGVAALSLCVTSVGAVVFAAEPAHAFCNNGTPVTISGPIIGGFARGSLSPASGTCNGNGVYTGYLYDNVADGRGVFLYLCAGRNGPCSEFYEGGAGSAPTKVSRSDSDNEMLVRLRWGSESTEWYMRGF